MSHEDCFGYVNFSAGALVLVSGRFCLQVLERFTLIIDLNGSLLVLTSNDHVILVQIMSVKAPFMLVSDSY